jgi:hypothetical protein
MGHEIPKKTADNLLKTMSINVYYPYELIQKTRIANKKRKFCY